MTVAVACAGPRGRGLARVLRRDGVLILNALGLESSELSIVIVGDAAMRRMNREFRAIDEPTDVLSFPQFEASDAVMRSARRGSANGAVAARRPARFPDLPNLPNLPIGDVVISVDTAGRQARELGQGIEARARDLLIHGVLHLIGYDHERSAAAARRMFARERELAARLAADGGRGRTAAARGRYRPNLAMRRRANPAVSTAMLTHFTRPSRGGDAIDNLAAILRAGVISGSSRMVRGGGRAVCLFDAALNELRGLLVRDNRRRYEPFGIAVDKRYAFRMGARPVIYMPPAEAERMLPPAELWRVVALDLGRTPAIDWSFEHEWRVAGDLALPPAGAVALVRSWRDADEIYERFDGHPPCAGVIPLDDLFGRN